jgi:DNA-directed RNA polymerase specialized sigma24 family protein
VSVEQIRADAFTEFVRDAEPRLKVALCSAFGADAGLEATADALAYGWENWDRVAAMQNPVGYLWGVGRNQARRRRPRIFFYEVDYHRLPDVEPGLPAALAALSERQRLAVMLIHCFGWSLFEVAELLGLSKTTVQNHVERALAKLRKELGVEL